MSSCSLSVVIPFFFLELLWSTQTIHWARGSQLFGTSGPLLGVKTFPRTASCKIKDKELNHDQNMIKLGDAKA